MKAVSTAGGGVMFIPEQLERKGAAISYRELLNTEEGVKTPRVFGKRNSKPEQQAAA
jgi:hypothetical protein